jgi:hypothetical protein
LSRIELLCLFINACSFYQRNRSAPPPARDGVQPRFCQKPLLLAAHAEHVGRRLRLFLWSASDRHRLTDRNQLDKTNDETAADVTRQLRSGYERHVRTDDI